MHLLLCLLCLLTLTLLVVHDLTPSTVLHLLIVLTVLLLKRLQILLKYLVSPLTTIVLASFL